MSIPAKRSRATHEQLSHMVDFMYDNPGFTGAKSLKFYGRLERDRIWSELAEVLNSFSGAVKTVEQWQSVGSSTNYGCKIFENAFIHMCVCMLCACICVYLYVCIYVLMLNIVYVCIIQVWKDLKSRTSTKVRNKKNQKAGNGKNTSYQEPITDLEKRVIAVIGRDYIESSSVGKQNKICIFFFSNKIFQACPLMLNFNVWQYNRRVTKIKLLLLSFSSHINIKYSKY